MYTNRMRKIQKTSLESYLPLLGGFIIFIGVVILAIANQWFGLDARNSWPIYLLLPGLVELLFCSRIKGAVLHAALVFLGTLQLLLGMLFFSFTLEVFQWSDMRSLWPVFVLIPGLTLLAAYWMGGRKLGMLLTSGAALSASALVVLPLLQIGGNMFNLSAVWPLLIITVGIALVVVSLLRRNSR